MLESPQARAQVANEMFQCEICGDEHPGGKMTLFPVEDGEETRVEAVCRKCIKDDF